MNTGKDIRLQKIWKHRRAVIVPYDHGSYGGPQAGIEDTLRLTERLSRTRADGVLVPAGLLPHIAPAVGRNVWQHPRMEKIIATLCAIVHDDQTVAQAKKLLR